MHAVNQCPTAISNVAIFAEPVGTRQTYCHHWYPKVNGRWSSSTFIDYYLLVYLNFYLIRND